MDKDKNTAGGNAVKGMDTDKTTASADKKAAASNMVVRYVRYLKLQRNYSPNTLDAYTRDLDKLLVFLSGEGKSVLDTTLDDLQQFAATLHDIGIGPVSQCRRRNTRRGGGGVPGQGDSPCPQPDRNPV